MGMVQSKDGTAITYERLGSGPAVVLLRPLVDRSLYAPHARALAEHFTVYSYDRRAQSQSGNATPYAVEREIEDVAALVSVAETETAGGPVCLYGISTGGAIALEAVAAGVQARRSAVYEVPYCVTDQTQRRWRDYVDQLWVALGAGNFDDALELFLRFSGTSEFEIIAARNSPNWNRLAADAPMLAYDAASMGDGTLPAGRFAKITQPVLVITGDVPADARLGMAGMPSDFYDLAADAITASVPHATRMVFAGCSHEPDPVQGATVLSKFFTAP